MIPYIRRNSILELIKSKDIIYMEELAETLGVSLSTARRDLHALAKDGEIVLLRGGAAKLKSGSYDLPVNKKKHIHTDEKERIGKRAAELVSDGDVIYIDSGTTAATMVPYLDRSNITVVTSNILVVNELIRMGISCIILGGDIILELESVVGSITEKMLDNMYFDKAFIGTNGFSERGGVSTCDAREARKKEMAKDNAREVYVLADSSKANRRAFYRAFSIDECTFITDEVCDILEARGNYILA